MPNHKTKPKTKKYPVHLMRRNAAPTIPRAPRKTTAPEPADMPALRKLAPLAAGATGMAVVGTLLAREGWKPKTIAGALTAAGAALAMFGHGDKVREVALGAASAGVAQLVMLMWGDHETPAHPQVASAEAKPRQAAALPPGALESAFERARRRLALDADEAERYGRAA